MHDDDDDLTVEERAIYRARDAAAASWARPPPRRWRRWPDASRCCRAHRPGAARATADAVIVLWMAGGMAQTETFDPKRYTPFAPGVRVDQVLSTFPTIDTAVDHIKFTAGPRADRQRHRSRRRDPVFIAADLGFILHSRHQYHWHTGYIPPQPMAMPHIGAVDLAHAGTAAPGHAGVHCRSARRSKAPARSAR